MQCINDCDARVRGLLNILHFEMEDLIRNDDLLRVSILNMEQEDRRLMIKGQMISDS